MRDQYGHYITVEWQFNFFQLVLIGASIVFGITLIIALLTNLLGNVDMQIMGNNSYAYRMIWYTDRITHNLPLAGTYSAPIWVWKVLMLIWSLWLTNAVLKWIIWGWNSWSKDAMWKKKVYTHSFQSASDNAIQKENQETQQNIKDSQDSQDNP